MSDAFLRFAHALDFAARKHAHQRRKSELEEPYINHLAEVTRLLADASHGADPTLVIAGLLHDTLEDTETTFDELLHEFGRDVAQLVTEVSDDKSLLKPERKRRQVIEAPNKSARARMIKLADKISNLRSIAGSPPKGWSLDRKLDYFEWAKQVADGCRGVSLQLEDEFDRVWREGMAALEAEQQKAAVTAR